MWTGLNTRRAATCSLRTLLFVQVVPWLGFSFVSWIVMPMFIVPNLATGPSMHFYIYLLIAPAAVFSILSVIKDVGFLLWARRKLHSELRVRATGVGERRAVPQTAIPPVIPEQPASA
jgi:hypothetical protein